LPRVSGREVVKALLRAGYEQIVKVAVTSFSDSKHTHIDASSSPIIKK
jgi:predicted RNA binding protein YcfA (HicA-like mRNA interferase family)